MSDRELTRRNGAVIQNYRAFLLRCWREEETGPERESAWRFTLVHFDDRQVKKGFACLEALVAYLPAELQGCEEQ